MAPLVVAGLIVAICILLIFIVRREGRLPERAEYRDWPTRRAGPETRERLP